RRPDFAAPRFGLRLVDAFAFVGQPARKRRRSRVRTLRALASGAFLTSEPQRRSTAHPLFRRVRSTTRSRLRLRSNLPTQNSTFVAGAAPFSNQARPCQKSPSTNTASWFSLKTKSGFPNTFVSFRLKRSPRAL